MTDPRKEARIPRATYRLQFHREFDFDAAVRIVPYLARLGISHVYCSPISRARPGSTHGYDVVAHDEINPELGGPAGHARFSAALQAHGMGQILDMVPNHMGVLGGDNAWWSDVLENGPASAYALYFDIDWNPLDEALQGKVLLPVLGDHYGHVLAAGDLQIGFEPAAGAFVLRYHEHHFPIDPRSFAAVLEPAAAACSDARVRDTLMRLAGEFALLPARSATEPEAIARREHDKAAHRMALAKLAAADPAAMEAIEAALHAFNADGPRDALHQLLDAQAYRLAFWRVAADEINYRRFFDINELAAVRVEHAPVFEATQGMALDLAARGVVDGLRIDHPDGLHDPAQYFERLQHGFAARAGITLPAAADDSRPPRPLYVVAEKIAATHESLPEDWSVHGTTGYRFATEVNGVLIDTTARAKFDRIWHRFTDEDTDFEVLAYQGKRAVMRHALASELTVLATQLLRIARSDRRTRDHTYNSLRGAVAEVAACLPVYRTYLVEQASVQDRRYIDWAVAHARQRSPGADASVFDFVRRCLLGEAPLDAPAGVAEAALRFAMRFQQFSAPVAAKGVEDTAFYLDTRLASLNEVGGDPAHFGMTLRTFHRASAARAARWPHTMLATSTHDNKRSEDVRHRIDVLSEVPAAWRLATSRWQRLNRSLHAPRVEGSGVAPETRAAPSAAGEYLLYQTLLGTLPAEGLTDATLGAYRERIEAYMLKAARESKAHTSWVAPNRDYEAALSRFVGALLARVQPNPFLTDMQAQAGVLAWFGALNSLTMALVKYSSPGVPDLYQGNELMDLSLVDPDNRRPVDYELRARHLDELEAISSGTGIADAVSALAASPHDGRAKLWFIWRLLTLRRECPALFERGGYTALAVRGPQASNVIAFERRHGNETLVVIAGRLFAGLGLPAGQLPLGEAAWGDTVVALPGCAEGARLVDRLSGQTLRVHRGAVRVADAFNALPGAALVAEDAPVATATTG